MTNISRFTIIVALFFLFCPGTSFSANVVGVSNLSVTNASLSFSGKDLKAGDTTTLKASVANIGTVTATSVVVRFFVDAKQIYEKKVTSLGKNAKSSVTYLYHIPTTTIAPFVFSVSLDPDNTVTESDETDNTSQINVPVSPIVNNLLIDTFKPSNTKPKPGQQISWTVKIKNDGNAGVTNVKLALYADMNSPQPTSVITISSINAKASVTKSIPWTVPMHLNPATGYLVRVLVDPDNAISESNKLDNAKNYSLSLSVPDLSVSPGQYFKQSSIVYPGAFGQIWAKVTNDNVEKVSNVKLGLYYSLGSLSAPRTKLADTQLSVAKKSTAEYMFDRVFTPAAATVGSRIFLFVVVDPDNAITESNEANNEIMMERSVVERPAQAQCPCLNVVVYDEDGKPTTATVKAHISGFPNDVTKTAGADPLNNNASGFVTFENLPQTGPVTLTVSRNGYRVITDTFTYDKTNETTTYRNYDLDKRAVLQGVVTNSSGQPLPWVTVKVDGTSLETVTDAQGKYGFMLNGGNYTLRFLKTGYARIIESNFSVSPLSTLTLDKTMQATTAAYTSMVITNDEGVGLANVDIYVNGTMIGTTAANGNFTFNNMTLGTKIFKFQKPGYIETQFSQVIEAGNEYNLSFTMFKPSTDTHVERGAEIVSWHQHEGTPANTFFIPEYNVDVWWGIGRVKMGLDFTKTGSDAKLTKLIITDNGLGWECNKVEGEGSIETSAIDIPVTISAGSCSTKKTQMDVYKVAIESDGQEVWSDESFWTTASDPQNSSTKVFALDKLQVLWNNNFKVKMWVRVQKRAVVGTDGDGAGALTGYHLDKKLITWYPQKPPTTVISTSWSQVGGYFLGILDNPVSAVTGFTDIFTVENFNQYSMEEVLPPQFPGAPPNN